MPKYSLLDVILTTVSVIVYVLDASFSPCLWWCTRRTLSWPRSPNAHSLRCTDSALLPEREALTLSPWNNKIYSI